jgi:hypothetical protein
MHSTGFCVEWPVFCPSTSPRSELELPPAPRAVLRPSAPTDPIRSILPPADIVSMPTGVPSGVLAPAAKSPPSQIGKFSRHIWGQVSAGAPGDEDGNFIQELVSGSRLAAPWGITIAPPGFRRFSNDVLVGNFSFLHSEINAFIPSNGKLHGTIPIDTGGKSPGGLWAIEFGVGGSNGSPDVLYFADGINGEMDGLFGAITSH